MHVNLKSYMQSALGKIVTINKPVIQKQPQASDFIEEYHKLRNVGFARNLGGCVDGHSKAVGEKEENLINLRTPFLHHNSTLLTTNISEKNQGYSRNKTAGFFKCSFVKSYRG